MKHFFKLGLVLVLFSTSCVAQSTSLVEGQIDPPKIEEEAIALNHSYVEEFVPIQRIRGEENFKKEPVKRLGSKPKKENPIVELSENSPTFKKVASVKPVVKKPVAVKPVAKPKPVVVKPKPIAPKPATKPVAPKPVTITTQSKPLNTITFKLSFYTCLASENGGYTVTATGKKLVGLKNTVASNYYALGTKIHLNGYGTMTVADRGGSSFNSSRRLDVLVQRKAGESNSQYLRRVNNMGVPSVTGYIIK